MKPSSDSPADNGTQLIQLAELAIDRHNTRHAEHPQRAAAAYLRMALVCARELSRQATENPAIRRAAQHLVTRVISIAHEAEEACFLAGGNSAPYFNVLVQAEALRAKLAQITQADSAPTPMPSLPSPTAQQPEQRHHPLARPSMPPVQPTTNGRVPAHTHGP